MADLDDFFAKKDRKKKSVKKFATAEEMAKKLDDGKQKSEVRPKKERPAQEGEEGGRAGEEEEWKEYEEPVKDYTGLKIQVLQGGPAPEAQTASEESAPEGGKTKGPWNKPQEQVAPPPEPEKPKEVKPAPPASTAYVPPWRASSREPSRSGGTPTSTRPTYTVTIHSPCSERRRRGCGGRRPAGARRPAAAPRSAPPTCASRSRSGTASTSCRTTASQVTPTSRKHQSEVSIRTLS
ncbi:protein CDV3 homolog isoform X3 [Leguminivora glycinivorella]|uniref:protein CDV3 homolog isoform X2 n=1 Tax=Leguminivora glycinivorella TaxID=1035111 RepID=UPI00200D30F5|nr:protein CDV3 homolog isoform X2 [Leguminivora glycinivorella]XP_048002030.1 protein CDV3 homolog isoform X3 [Leguminivora glycinivorella]